MYSSESEEEMASVSLPECQIETILSKV